VPPLPPLRIHPNLADVYRQKVANLEEALNRPEERDEAHAALRTPIGQVILYLRERRGEVWAQL
jgi:hypothetical protein